MRSEDNVRVDVESELGYASGSKSDLTQGAKDGERIVENTCIRAIGSAVGGVGKIARPVGLIVVAVQIGSAV